MLGPTKNAEMGLCPFVGERPTPPLRSDVPHTAQAAAPAPLRKVQAGHGQSAGGSAAAPALGDAASGAAASGDDDEEEEEEEDDDEEEDNDDNDDAEEEPSRRTWTSGPTTGRVELLPATAPAPEANPVAAHEGGAASAALSAAFPKKRLIGGGLAASGFTGSLQPGPR